MVSGRRCRTLLLSPDNSLAEDLGEVAEVIWVPVLKLNILEGSSLKVLEAMRACRNIAFTSPRAIRALVEDASTHGILGSLYSTLKEAFIAVIGSKTGEEVLKQLGRPPDYVASKHYSKSMLMELAGIYRVNCLVIPRSTEGVRDINSLAKELGVDLVDISVYKPEPLTEGIRKARELLERGLVDIVILSSPMIARLLCESLIEAMPMKVKFVAMGETTFKSMPRQCIESRDIVVGDGSVETLKAIIKNICG